MEVFLAFVHWLVSRYLKLASIQNISLGYILYLLLNLFLHQLEAYIIVTLELVVYYRHY